MIMHPQHELKVYEAIATGEMEIDPDGRIWRLRKRTADRWTGGTRTTTCDKVRAESTSGGYLQVRLMRDGHRVAAAAHRLVWLHVHGPIPDGLTVNHKNGIKSDNRPENLELATYSEQRIHAIRVLGAKHHDVRGSLHPKTTLVEAQVVEMRYFGGLTELEIAEALGISERTVRRSWDKAKLLLTEALKP